MKQYTHSEEGLEAIKAAAQRHTVAYGERVIIRTESRSIVRDDPVYVGHIISPRGTFLGYL